ncbi:hypothetical protein BH686_04870 [Rhodococcus erythropolis]|nr:hypothetical protein BH686_04870 [Rhodococcus erythropolis]
MLPNLKLLRDDMDDLARTTWDDLVDGEAYGIKFREDTFTDRNLLALAKGHRAIRPFRHDQSREKTTGADWEWWIGSAAEGWICLRIQAKRIHSRSYKYLSHDGELDDEYQYDTLIRGCDEDWMYPFHVFYNGWDDNRFTSEPEFGADLPLVTLAIGDRRDVGCAVASTHSVKQVHGSHRSGRNSVLNHSRVSVPWSYLFAGTSAYPIKRSRIVGGVGSGRLDALQQGIHAVAVTGERGDGMLHDWRQMVSIPVLRESRRPDLPDYVSELILGSEVETTGQLPAARMTILTDLDKLREPLSAEFLDEPPF